MSQYFLDNKSQIMSNEKVCTHPQCRHGGALQSIRRFSINGNHTADGRKAFCMDCMNEFFVKPYKAAKKKERDFYAQFSPI